MTYLGEMCIGFLNFVDNFYWQYYIVLYYFSNVQIRNTFTILIFSYLAFSNSIFSGIKSLGKYPVSILIMILFSILFIYILIEGLLSMFFIYIQNNLEYLI